MNLGVGVSLSQQRMAPVVSQCPCVTSNCRVNSRLSGHKKASAPSGYSPVSAS